jgi:hypothetical protein
MMHQLYLTQLLVADRMQARQGQADSRRRWLSGRRSAAPVTSIDKRWSRRHSVATTRAA